MNELENINLDFTVAIPTYNGEKRLPQVLDKLLMQRGIENLHWEIIIIDNNSSDNTATLVKNYPKKTELNCSLKYFLEKKQGAAFARIRAVKESSSSLIAFVDDDNLLTDNWLAEAYVFGIEHPKAGAWGSQIHANFEVEPPDDFKKIQGFLAIREHGEEASLFDPNNLRLPPSAALVIRKQAWCENVPEQPMLSGKLPGIFVQGDDYEPLLYIYRGGWEIWYNPAMRIYHQIPKWRLEKDYLLTLARGCGLCTFELRLINAKNWQQPIILIKTIFGNLRRIIKHRIQYAGRLENNLIAVFEIEFYWASMMSPLYSFRLRLNKFIQKNNL